MKQYLVNIHKGLFESQSIASIQFYCVMEDDKDYNATEIATLFKEAFDEYCIRENKEADRYELFKTPQRDKEWYFNHIFNTDCDGFVNEAFEEKGFLMCFYPYYKITKIVSLAIMDNYLTKQDHWYFNNLQNNQVSCEVFDEYIV